MGVVSHKKARLLLQITLFLTFFLVAFLGTVRLLVRGGETVRAPSVVGLREIEAEKLVEERGLRLEVGPFFHHEEIPKGHVIRQSVAEGEKVKAGRTIQVTLSQGPRNRTVPYVAGLDGQMAEAILSSSQLKGIEKAAACSGSVPAGAIIAQGLEAGAQVTQTEVPLLMSTGPCSDRFLMPNLVGQIGREAQGLLADHRMMVRATRYEKKSELPSGVVIRQKPKPGTIVRPFDPIELTLSSPASTQAVKPKRGSGRFLYWTRAVKPGFFRKPFHFSISRGAPLGTYEFDMVSTPGKNLRFVFFVTSGDEVAISLAGHQIFREER